MDETSPALAGAGVANAVVHDTAAWFAGSLLAGGSSAACLPTLLDCLRGTSDDVNRTDA